MDFLKLNDDEKAQYIVDVFITGEREQDANSWENMRAMWAGNYMRLGTPLFHHPLLKEHDWGVVLCDCSGLFMGRNNESAFNSLPDVLTIYRGGDNTGCSWSLSYEVAASFGEVHTITIEKSEVYAYVNDREEQEIILL